MNTLDLFQDAVTLEDTDLLHLKRGTGANSDKRLAASVIKALFATAAQGAKVDFITVTQAVDLDDIEARVNALDASVVLKGSWDASSGSFPGGGTAQTGFSYIVTVAGTVDSISFNVNDRLLAITDNASTGTFAANWLKLDYTDQVLSVAGLTGAISASALRTALNVEDGATADQTDLEIETAYNNQVDAASQAEMEAGTEAAIRRMSPLRIAQAITALGTGGSGVSASFKTGAYTAVAGDIVGVGSDTAAITITLPASPATDAYVAVWDADDNAGTNNITVARNGNTIDGAAEDFVINIDGGRVDLIYNGTTWKVAYSTPGAAGFTGVETWRFHAYDFSQVSGETTRVQSGPSSQFDALTMADTGFNWAATPIIMPKRWDGGQFRFRVVWTPTTTNTGDIVMGLFGDEAADGGAFPAIGSTGPTVIDTAQGTADRIHISDWSSWDSFAGPPVANELIQLRIQRNGGSGSDTHTGTIELIMVEVQWRSNAPTDD